MSGTLESEPRLSPLEIRPPSSSEFPYLSALCLRSKAVWGYDRAFLEACRTELSFEDAELFNSDIGVGMSDGMVVGVVQVRAGSDHADLEKIFVEPRHRERGFGRIMFEWALQGVRSAGAPWLVVHADPAAAPFYRAMGMVDDRQAPSGSIAGRMLPRLILSTDSR
jgi:GNAT superfamily N-acetyltransferase